jgi:hypothetical protein
MLYLKRITHPTDFFKCDASGKILMYGDFYYEDDTDGKRIDAQYYYQEKQKRRKEQWPYTKILNEAKSQKEYQDRLKQVERDVLTNEMLDRPVFNKDSNNSNPGEWV